jgi:hypothetical protein
MDTIRDPKMKKNESVKTLRKQSQDNPIDALIETPPDLNDLPEVDYNDPNVIAWLKEVEEDRLKKYGRLTAEEFEYMFCRQLDLKEKFPDKTIEEINKIALLEHRSGQTVPTNISEHIEKMLKIYR